MVKMQFCLIGCLLLLPACDPTQTVKLISPQIPAELLEPVAKPDRQVATLKDTGLLLIDYDQALSEANGKIEATGEIIASFNKRIEKAQ